MEDWIITFSNSEDTDIYFYRFYGTEEDVKKKLLKMAKERTYECAADLLRYPEDIEDIEQNTETGTLYCIVDYDEYGYVFTAMEFTEISYLY